MVTTGGRHALGGGVAIRAAAGIAGGALATCGAAGECAGANPSATSSLYLKNHVQRDKQGRNRGMSKCTGWEHDVWSYRLLGPVARREAARPPSPQGQLAAATAAAATCAPSRPTWLVQSAICNDPGWLQATGGGKRTRAAGMYNRNFCEQVS